MPIYLYRCDACNKKFERRQSINDEPLLDCDFCNTKGALSKLPQNIQFNIKVEKTSNQNAGEVVEETIEEEKRTIEKEREELKNRVFDPSMLK